MRKLFGFASLLVLVLIPLSSAGGSALDPSPADLVDHACCEQAAAECEWHCTQGIRTFWCESDAYGPGTCAVQCDCWIWE